jgi:hypothetical protein
MATGDILAVRASGVAKHNGWIAETDIDNLAVAGAYNFGLGPTNDPVAALAVFTVTSLGYDPTGAATTLVRKIYGTNWQRQAYPTPLVADETTVSTLLTTRESLSDFIYASDSVIASIGAGLYTQGTASHAVTGMAVTNNSTLTYPQSVGRWAWPAFETVRGDFLLEACVFNRFARNGKPVACVIFTVTDAHSNSVSRTVTDMTVSTRGGDPNAVLVYAATIPIAGFVQGDVLTCNWTAYPWVGDAGALLTSASGITPPDERLCPLLLLCDKTGAYRGGSAVVASTGNASAAATWVAENPEAAEEAYAVSTANAYTTIGFAVQAIKAWNTANLGRNDCGGGVVLLAGAVNDYPGTSPADQGAQGAWLTLTRLSTVPRANAVINTGSNASLNCRRVKMVDVTLSGTSTGQIAGFGVTDSLWVHNCTINMTGTAPFYGWASAYATQNTVTALAGGFTSFSTQPCPFGLVRGNLGADTLASSTWADAYCVIGNRNLQPHYVETGDTGGQQSADGGVVAFNTNYKMDDVWFNCPMNLAAVLAQGFAIVQNVVEKINAVTPMAWFFGDSTVGASNNLLLHNNTLVGERLNIGYNSTGAVAFLHKNYSVRNNLIDSWNNKDDTFTGDGGANAARTGAWPVGADVGCWGNWKRETNSTEWAGEFVGLWTVQGIANDPTAWTFVADRSNNNGGGGSGAGDGDYHLVRPSLADAKLVPFLYSCLPYDIEGKKRVSGAANYDAPGAYRLAPPTADLFCYPSA